MKTITILPAILLAAVSFGTFAMPAPDAPGAQQEQAGKAPDKEASKSNAGDTASNKSAPADDKAGNASEKKATVDKRKKIRADKDRSKHFHPRDAK